MEIGLICTPAILNSVIKRLWCPHKKKKKKKKKKKTITRWYIRTAVSRDGVGARAAAVVTLDLRRVVTVDIDILQLPLTHRVVDVLWHYSAPLISQPMCI